MNTLGLAVGAQVVVVQLQGLEPDAGDGQLVAAVTGHPVVDSIDLLLLVLAGSSGDGGLLVPLEDEVELVQRPRHLGQGDDQLLVIADGHLHHHHYHYCPCNPSDE